MGGEGCNDWEKGLWALGHRLGRPGASNLSLVSRDIRPPPSRPPPNFDAVCALCRQTGYSARYGKAPGTHPAGPQGRTREGGSPYVDAIHWVYSFQNIQAYPPPCESTPCVQASREVLRAVTCHNQGVFFCAREGDAYHFH